MDECLRGHRIVVQFFLYGTIRARISWTVIFPLLTPSGRLHMRYTHSTHYDNRWDGLLDVCVLRFTALRALTYVCTWVCVCVWNGKYAASKQQTQQNQSKTGERLNSFSDSYDNVRMNRGFASWILTYPILRATYVWIYVSDSNHIHPSWMNTSNPAFLISFVCKKIFRETRKFQHQKFPRIFEARQFFNSHYFRYQKYSLCCVNNVDCMEFH